MLNKIIAYSLHNRMMVVALAAILMAVGIYASYNIEVDVFPDLNAPTVVVMTEASGMATEEVEQLVTFPIETAMNGASGVRRVRSSSTTGFSVVWVEFGWNVPIMEARQTVSEKLSIVAGELPAGAGTPVMGPQSSIMGEVLIVSLTADSTSMLDLRTLADWTIRPRLLSIGGVAQVSVLGGDIKEYQIQMDPLRMKHYGVSLDELLAASRAMNHNVGGGVVSEHGNEYIVRGMASTTDVAQMGRVVIKDNGGVPVCIDDVAQVAIGAQQPRLGCASERGKPAVLLTVTKQPHTGTLALTERLNDALQSLSTSLPSDVHVSTDAFRQSRFIERSIGNVRQALFEGAIFVVLVLFFFLANVRTMFISLVSLPLSLVITILVLHCMGISLNTMSMGGMAIAIGSLVDDAIVDVENVWKHLRANAALPADQRRGALRVVYDASCEVRMPILNSTLIIVVSFVPLFFLTGMEGRMLMPLGMVFIVSLFASTLVALTLTPVLCTWLLGQGGRQSDTPLSSHLRRWYEQALRWALHRWRAVIGMAAGLFVVALVCMFFLGRSFLPQFNEGSFTINLTSLPGISLEESDRLGRWAEELLLSVPEIQTVVRKTGRAELDEHALGVNVSEIEAPFELKDRSRAELFNHVRSVLSVIPGANIEIGQPISHRLDAMLSGTQAGISIKLFGTDLNRMYQVANEIKQAITPVRGIVDLNVEQQIERPELKIVPRREMLARMGIGMAEFCEFVRVGMAGEKVSEVYQDGRVFGLVVRVRDDMRSKSSCIPDLLIDTPDGRKVPLGLVAEVRSVMGPHAVGREDVQRKIVIAANAEGRDMQGVVNDIVRIIDQQITLPEGYHVELGGQFESGERASRVLFLTSLLSIVVIFLLLYAQFRKVSQSAVVLLNLPLALIGGVFALWLCSAALSIPALIGFISLFGIATRNGMLLVSHYNDLRAQGMALEACILKGSADRLNAILMTALTSALAMIPLVLHADLPGNEIQSPMARVILGGLLTSTLLNAFVVPIMYAIMYRNAKNEEK